MSKSVNVNKNLSKQVFIYSISTDSFMSAEEQSIHNQIMKFRGYKNKLKKYTVDCKRRKKFINTHINSLQGELKRMLDTNTNIRTLRQDTLNDYNKISQFESVLVRTLGITENETTTDIIVIRAYHYSIFKSIVENGFITESGEEYQYFTSSAGGIRNKKSVFIKKDVLKAIQNPLLAGLTVDRINNNGGMNVNKWNAYTALTMTASIPFENFNIDECVVVNDFETLVTGEVDHIDSKTYEIVRGERAVLIPHTDGAGICLPSVSDKAIQIRMPYFKGLLIPTPFTDFINVHEGASPIIKDIYGKEWNVIEDKISILFTRSQFKAWKYFDSWDDYKKAFKEYQCEASIANEEQEDHDDKTLNYQMIQTLTTMTDDELNDIASRSASDIAKMGNDLGVIKSSLGVTEENKSKNSLQQAIEIYPSLINDKHVKEVIRKTQKSMIKRANAGKLLLDGNKRTFISPDVYAFMEWLFAGIEKPSGLLSNSEVSCRLYEDGEELDVLRSPHLHKEHSVNTNVLNDKIKKYFITDCIFVSSHSLMSKVLQFDVDGDEALIVNNKTIVNRAKREMENIVPLDYELASAKPSTITNENIYKCLIAAYGKNIGEVSNQITKVFNSDTVDEDSLRVTSWLTWENNAIIDYAKTLWMPKRPPEIDKKIKQYTKGKVPYFFIQAKDKLENEVEEINNSVVNRLQKNKIIQSTRKHIKFKEVVDPFDYTKLLFNESVNIETEMAHKVISEYERLNRNKHWQIKKQAKIQDKSIKQVKFHVIKKIRNQLREILNDDIYITDVLVKYLHMKESKNNNLLWDCFGDVIVWNLKRNIDDVVECLDCGCHADKTKQRQIRCNECQKERNKKLERIRKRKKRAEKKVSA
ncbi:MULTISPECIES: hypothetical protein [Bacillaceae]|uniref:Uncharacterized protein n=1 Tax=Evansella alkalicola TaxID=745819 RepID=A0ABS6K1G0_9BACI|nr:MULTISPECIES: hypothetical protein [Bacillaceae]MBU9724141.1 hypothetical protein [Bacillus alkalicola]